MTESPQATTSRGFPRRTLTGVLRVALVSIMFQGALVAAAYSWLEREVLSTLPSDLSGYRDWRPPNACTTTAADGTVIDQFYVEKRVWVPLEELDPWTWQAFVAAEDRRFMEHPGVDLLGIARALWVNLSVGRDVQGASTITQQLVKNLIVGKERSYERKVKEAVLAWRLEQELSKAEILELYVNYIALGSGNYGVEAAAQDYFGVSARDLDPGQAAMLAGLVPAPSRYSPRRDPVAAAHRRDLVLGAMVEEGFLEVDLAASFLDDPVLVERRARPVATVGGAYVTQVRREVRSVLGEEVPFTEGLRIHTALDLRLQGEAEAAIREALENLQQRQGRRGALRRIAPDDWKGFAERGPGLHRDSGGGLVFPEPGACFEALVGASGDLDELAAGPWHFVLGEADRRLRVRVPARGDERPDPEPLSEAVAAGDVLGVCLVSGTANLDEAGSGGARPIVRLDDRPWAEGAVVVIENHTGRVRALVGGWEVGLEGFVRATQARRQPGSSFKPYVYATALDGGRTQVDTVMDAALSLPGAGATWSPKNYDGGYAGPVPMRRALARSLNTVSVRLVLESGVPAVVATARSMGVKTPLRQDPTLALGSSEVTPMDQAIGYATIARGGVPTEPVYVDWIEDVRGRTIGRAGDPVIVGEQTVAVLPGGPGPRALPPGVAYELADMMREVVRSGTARRARAEDFDRAGKTGTTNDFVDAWFVGFTPRHTVAVWIGTDGTWSLGDRETGGKAALPAWVRVVDALGEPPGERLPVPDETMLVPWEGSWVGLVRGNVPERALATRGGVDGAPLLAFPGMMPAEGS